MKPDQSWRLYLSVLQQYLDSKDCPCVDFVVEGDGRNFWLTRDGIRDNSPSANDCLLDAVRYAEEVSNKYDESDEWKEFGLEIERKLS